MESSRWRWRRSGRSMLKLVALCLPVAISLCCVCAWACSGSGCRRGGTVLLSSVCNNIRVLVVSLVFGRRTAAPFDNQEISSGGGQWLARRLLAEGPGSYPPRCTAKCGDCRPCYPVHVAVPPGVPVTTEYYPEAWRCKCGSRLYMP